MKGTILRAMDHRQLFAQHFTGPTWDRWRVFLKALFALPMTDAEQVIYQHHTQRQKLPTAPFREAWVVAGRRAGKSRIAALVAVFLAACKDYAHCLAPGETAVVMVLAADKRQARVIFRYARALIVETPALKAMLEHETQDTLSLTNRVAIEIHVSNFKSVRGYTAAAVIADEVAFWPPSDTALSADETVNALRPSLTTIDGSLLLGLSSPHAKRGVLFEQFRRYHARDDAPVLTWRGTSQEMNSNISDAVVQAAMDADEAVARSEYLGHFRSDVESFIAREQVDAVVIPGRTLLPPVAGFAYCAHVDAAGGSGADSFTAAIAHSDEQGRAVLDVVLERRPPFSPQQVAEEFAAALKEYRCTTAQADRYAGDWPTEAFAKHGVRIEPCARNRSELYLELLPAITAGRVELLDDRRLISQLVNLERRVGRGNSRDTVDHPSGSGHHDDRINAAAGALIAAKANTFVAVAPISMTQRSYWTDGTYR
jgi:hypothetical protein